jgi:hypothetical protein
MPILLEGGREDLAPAPAEAGFAGALLIPAGPTDLAPHYDLTISHPAMDAAPFAAFDRWLARAAVRRGLSCALLHDGVIGEAAQRIAAGRLTVGFHLDYFALWHVADDPYARLAQAVEDAGGRSVNSPARSRAFTDKAAAHAELVQLGLGVPETVIFRSWTPDRPFTAAERTRLRLDEPGAAVYIKPANGFASRGVVRVERTDPAGFVTALAVARSHDRGDTFLVQREIHCPRLPCDDGIERPAYWRVLYCLGDLIPLWWSSRERAEGRPSYRRVTAAEALRLHLGPVFATAGELAELSGLEWFSTELCLSDGPEPSRHTVWCPDGRLLPVIAIDYLNDQCDVDIQSRWPGAPPDAVVRHVAERFADAAWRTTTRRQRDLPPRPAA